MSVKSALSARERREIQQNKRSGFSNLKLAGYSGVCHAAVVRLDR